MKEVKKFKIVKNTNRQVIVENTITGTQYYLDLIYNHQDLGKFYSFTNLLNLPYMRKAAFDVVRGLETLGISGDELEEKINAIYEELEFQESGFAQRALIEVNFIKETLKNHWDFKKTLSLIVGLCIVPESQLEDIGDYDQTIIEQNLLEMSKDKNMLELFFLQVNSHLETLSNFAQTDTPNYSQMIKNLKQKEMINPPVMEKQSNLLLKVKEIWKNLF